MSKPVIWGVTITGFALVMGLFPLPVWATTPVQCQGLAQPPTMGLTADSTASSCGPPPSTNPSSPGVIAYEIFGPVSLPNLPTTIGNYALGDAANSSTADELSQYRGYGNGTVAVVCACGNPQDVSWAALVYVGGVWVYALVENNSGMTKAQLEQALNTAEVIDEIYDAVDKVRGLSGSDLAQITINIGNPGNTGTSGNGGSISSTGAGSGSSGSSSGTGQSVTIWECNKSGCQKVATGTLGT